MDMIPLSSLKEYEDLFERIDEDGSGFVEPHELRQQFIKVGLDINGVRQALTATETVFYYMLSGELWRPAQWPGPGSKWWR